MMFLTEEEAVEFFGKENEHGMDMVEQCTICEEYGASTADHEHGTINGINEEADLFYFNSTTGGRVCESCEEEAERIQGTWDDRNNPDGLNPDYQKNLDVYHGK